MKERWNERKANRRKTLWLWNLADERLKDDMSLSLVFSLFLSSLSCSFISSCLLRYCRGRWWIRRRRKGRDGRFRRNGRALCRSRGNVVIKLWSHYASISLHSLHLKLVLARERFNEVSPRDWWWPNAVTPLIPPVFPSPSLSLSLSLSSIHAASRPLTSCCAWFPRRVVPFLVLSSLWWFSYRDGAGKVACCDSCVQSR